MRSRYSKIKPIILSGCAVLALSACDQSKFSNKYKNSFASYEQPAIEYYGNTGTNGATYNARSTDIPSSYADDQNAVSLKSDIDVEVKAKSNEQSYRMEIKSQDQASHQANAVQQAAKATEATKSNVDFEPVMLANSNASVHSANDMKRSADQMNTQMASSAQLSATPVVNKMPAPSDNADIATLYGCPNFAIYPDMRSISFFKGSDKTKLIATAAINDIRGTCRTANNTLELDLNMLVDGRIGQHGRYQTTPDAEELQSYPYYVALINNTSGVVEYKKIFASILRFGTDKNIQSKYEDIMLAIPMPDRQTADAYTLNIGFQLSPEQLAYNRGQIGQKALMHPSTTTPAQVKAPAVTPAPTQMDQATAEPKNVYVPANETAPATTKAEAVQIVLETETPEMQMIPTEDVPTGEIEPSSPSASSSSYVERRFLKGRPRISVDPLKETYGGTFTE